MTSHPLFYKIDGNCFCIEVKSHSFLHTGRQISLNTNIHYHHLDQQLVSNPSMGNSAFQIFIKLCNIVHKDNLVLAQSQDYIAHNSSSCLAIYTDGSKSSDG